MSGHGPRGPVACIQRLNSPRPRSPRQPINQPKLTSNRPIDHSVDHPVDHSISISPLLLQPPGTRRVAVMMWWWLGHAQDSFSGRRSTSENVDGSLRRRLNRGLAMQPSHPLPDNSNSDSKPGQRHSAQRRQLSIGRLHALSACTIQSIRAFSGSRARNSVLGELGLDNRFFCCGGQTASLLAPLAEAGHGTHCDFGT